MGRGLGLETHGVRLVDEPIGAIVTEIGMSVDARVGEAAADGWTVMR